MVRGKDVRGVRTEEGQRRANSKEIWEVNIQWAFDHLNFEFL